MNTFTCTYRYVFNSCYYYWYYYISTSYMYILKMYVIHTRDYTQDVCDSYPTLYTRCMWFIPDSIHEMYVIHTRDYTQDVCDSYPTVYTRCMWFIPDSIHKMYVIHTRHYTQVVCDSYPTLYSRCMWFIPDSWTLYRKWISVEDVAVFHSSVWCIVLTVCRIVFL